MKVILKVFNTQMINFKYFSHEDETAFLKIYIPNNIDEILSYSTELPNAAWDKFRIGRKHIRHMQYTTEKKKSWINIKKSIQDK